MRLSLASWLIALTWITVAHGQTCTLTVTPNPVTVDSAAQSVVLSVSASDPSCAWSATSQTSFVTIQPSPGGTGSGAITISVAENGTGADRTGVVTIAELNVTISQVFTGQLFTDVPPSAYYFDAVNLLKSKNITAGCSPTMYCPSQEISRAQMAIFLVRAVMGGDNFIASQTPYFTDVPANAFGFQWIQKLYELGITSGCGVNLYCPNDNTTRAQMAIFLIRMRYGATAVFDSPSLPYFSDVPVGSFAFNWIQRLREDNITSGCAATEYCPHNAVIRGDMAIFMMRAGFNQLLPPTEPILTQVSPVALSSGQTASVTITGLNTHFSQGSSTVSSIPGFTVGAVTVTSGTTLGVSLTAGSAPTPQPESVLVISGNEEAVYPNVLQISSGPLLISSFTPVSGAVGTLVTLGGSGLVSSTGMPATVTLAGLDGPITVPVSSSSLVKLSFVLPAGAATGPISVSLNGASAQSASAFTVTAPNTFTLTAVPATATLFPGVPDQKASYAIQIASANGFSQLAPISISGLPAGITYTLNPSSITAGQTAILTLTAPANQPVGTATVSITASATVATVPVSQTSKVSLVVSAPISVFLARTVVSDALQTPLAGVTAKMLGQDGNLSTTTCSGSGVSDAAGNVVISNLSSGCIGPQLVGFDGTTASSPPGTYAGVNIVYTFTAGQPTASSVLVHLPRIDNVETFPVQQNSPSDQTFVSQSIPGLKLIVYANTTFVMPDQSTPNPFPLAAVQVPVDRLPDNKPAVPTLMRVFIVAFQPANVTASQPVAVFYPNTLNTPPNTVGISLMTLDPTHGQMVPYGTGSVSADGTQIVPDEDAIHSPHLYGLMHFDWHGPMPPPPPAINPSPTANGTATGTGNTTCGGSAAGPPPCNSCPCTGGNPNAGEPVDLSSGLYVSNVIDMSLSSGRGTVNIQRIYRTLSTNDGPFGFGSGAIFNYSLDVAAVSSAQVINLINPDGSEFMFTRQMDGTLTNSTVPSLQGAVMTTTSGDQATLRYKNGTSMVFQRFGALSFEISQTDANGNTISISRNAGQILSITDPVGRQLIFTPDTANANHIALITDPIGRTVKYTYNPTGTLATFTDPAGDVTQYFYDSQNRLSSVIDPRNITILQNVFDANGRVIQQTQADNGVTTIAYSLGNPTAENSFVMSTTVQDPRKNITTYRFNPQGFVITAVDALGQTTTFNRDPGTNLVLSSVGNAICPVCGPTQAGDFTFTYDANGNMTSRTDSLGNRASFVYDPVFSKILMTKDPLGYVTQFVYDSRGNLTQSTDANGNVNSFQYDANGLLIQATDALKKTTTFTNDVAANLVMRTDPLNNATSFGYDGISRRTLAVDALNRRTTFAYDPLSRLTQQTNAKGGLTTFAYDGNSNLLSVTDANQNQTVFTYDSMNRLSTRKNPLQQTDSRLYDANGNLTKFVDRRGQTSTYTYDALNRLGGETYQDATVVRAYDARSHTAMVTDSESGDFTFAYDLDGRQTSSSTPFGSIAFAYDPRGLMMSRQVQGQPALAYSYDRVGNLTSAAMAQVSAAFTYTPRNRVAALMRANGVTSSYSYDDDARLLSISHASASSLIETESYGYDPVGNRLNHVSSITQPLITQVTANQFNANNEMTQFGSTLNVYDANGNLTQDGSATYSWDGRSRLKSIVTNRGQTTAFTYDFSGNMLEQADSGSALNLTKFFVLDDVTDIAYQSASDGSSSSILAGRSIDSHLATLQSNNQSQYGLSDGVNSTIETTDQTGVPQATFFYEPFGLTTASGSYPFEFTGRVSVSNSVYYNRARFYNTQTGRFISEDPIDFAGGDVNLYSYVGNNPIVYGDPLGLYRLKTGPIGVGAFPPTGQLADVLSCMDACNGEITVTSTSEPALEHLGPGHAPHRNGCAADIGMSYDVSYFQMRTSAYLCGATWVEPLAQSKNHVHVQIPCQ